ncbi:MAG: efflux RND transporter periplasmic adaptor subunit [Candidatus Paceibacterota bacterium]|jgi:RND family efflux transporter MFP subunit
MNKLFALFKRKYVYWGAGAAVLLVGGFFLFSGDNSSANTIIINKSDFVNQVSISGKVVTASEADLGFAASGRIGRIYVKNNNNVRAGQTLAQLEISDLLADLKIKEINSKTSSASLDDARENVEKVTTQQDTKVESAYRKLLGEDLDLIPDSNSYTVETPTISGIYDGPEGTYKLIMAKENVTLSDVNMRTFGLEKTDREINEEGPTPLGTRGLFISFEDDVETYDDTTWFLNIPNKSGASYLANYNAYNEAKKARDLAIKDAEFEYQKLLTEENGGMSSVAQAEIDKIRADIRKNTIYAPFDGIITNIDKEVGETASSSETVLTMMGVGTFQIESFVPEVNIALIDLYAEAQVTLDAYGEDVPFNAKVIAIDPAETIKDGVSTYKVVLQFSEKDDRIKSGMTANVSIIIFNKPGVMVVPGGVILNQDGKNYVQIKTVEGLALREVVTGAVSTLGQVEIVSGLSEGDEVILNPDVGNQKSPMSDI